MKRGMRGAPPQLDTGQSKRSSVACCLCKQAVLMSGWCDNCDRWPINITPIRWCERGHRVDVDGLCMGCHMIVLTRLEPLKGEWRDTGEVAKLLSREENHQRLNELMAKLKAFGSPPPRKREPKHTISDRKRAELAAEHAHVRERMKQTEDAQVRR